VTIFLKETTASGWGFRYFFWKNGTGATRGRSEDILGEKLRSSRQVAGKQKLEK